MLKGVQQIGNLWRIYITSTEARAQLAATGIDVQNTHISLNTINPYSVFEKDGERPIKITLSGLKLQYTNEYIQKYLQGLGVRLVSDVQHMTIRGPEGQETNFINGNRTVLAEASYLRSHPLPQWQLIGDCITRVRHYGQNTQTALCNKCFRKDHPVWRCNFERACKVCRNPKQTHREGTEACPHYSENNGSIAFGGREHVLSNFHPCKFDYDGQTYISREQGFQHQKSIFCNSTEVADAIMKTQDPGKAKQYSKCINKCDTWENVEEDIFTDLCYAAAQQNEDYYDALINSEEQLLIEAVTDEMKWASGLGPNATLNTKIQSLPGKNKMGKIHMAVREKLLREKDEKREQNTPKDDRQPIHVDEDEEPTDFIEKHFQNMVDDGRIDNNIGFPFSVGQGRGLPNDNSNAESHSPNRTMSIGRGRAKRGHSNSSSPGKHDTPPSKLCKKSESPSQSYELCEDVEDLIDNGKASSPLNHQNPACENHTDND